ncbi:MAG: hypothetical protein V4671_24815 [Armatimonadota bacterium]
MKSASPQNLNCVFANCTALNKGTCVKKKKESLYTVAGIVAVAILGIVGFAFRSQSSRPVPTDKGYYTGPMVNRRGDLVTDDGVIVQRGYRPERAKQRPMPAD